MTDEELDDICQQQRRRREWRQHEYWPGATDGTSTWPEDALVEEQLVDLMETVDRLVAEVGRLRGLILA